jgi:hypothetical protein
MQTCNWYEVVIKRESGEVKTIHTSEMSEKAARDRLIFLYGRSFFGLGSERITVESVKRIDNEYVKDIDYQAALRSTQGVLHSDTGRGCSKINDYVTTMTEWENEMKSICGEVLNFVEQWKTFRQKAKQKYNEMLYKEGQRISANIFGPANFPTKRAHKKNQSAKKAHDEFYDFKQRAFKAITRKRNWILNQDKNGRLAEAKMLLRQQTNWLETMKKANKIFRSKKLTVEQKREQLKEFNFEDLERRLFPKYGQQGFKTFELANLRNRMKTTENNIQKISAQIEAKKSDRTGNVIYSGTTTDNRKWRFVESEELDRILFFSGDEYGSEGFKDRLNEMKRNGLKSANWSRKKAWLFRRTYNGRRKVKELKTFLETC